MVKIYKGYELIKAIENMDIEKETRFIDKYGNRYEYKNYGSLSEELDLVKIEKQGESIPDYSMFIDNEFTIIEEQKDIDIQELEEIDLEQVTPGDSKTGIALLHINKLIQAVKQLDKNIKDKE